MDNNQEDVGVLKENAKDITKLEFDDAVKLSQIFRDQAKDVEEKLFNFKIAFCGFLGIILAIIFSNINLFSSWFLFSVLTVTTLSFISIFIELRRDLSVAIPEFDRSVNELVIITNVRHIAVLRSDVNKNYIRDAQEQFRESNKIYQAMKAGRSIDDIVNEFGSHTNWRLKLAWWGVLFMSVPILFIFQFVYLK